MKKFDTDLSKSPVYADEDMLERLGACFYARHEFRDTFGEGAKIPVTRRNLAAVDANCIFLESGWLAEKFLDVDDFDAAQRRWFDDMGGKPLVHFMWPPILRKLKAQHPEFYAAKARASK